MRKLQAVAIVALGVAMSTVAFGADTKAATGSGKMMKPSVTAAMSDSALQEKLVAIENKVFEAFKNKDGEGFKNMIAKDCWMIDPSGMSDVDQSVAMMADYDIKSFSMENYKLVRLSQNVAALTYTAHVTASYKGQDMPPNPSYVATVYVNHNGKWIPSFHQETMAQSAEAGAQK